MSREPKPRSRRGAASLALYGFALAAVLAAAFVPFIPDGGLGELYDRTLGFQAGRDSPFSIWGQQPGLGWLHTGVKAAAVALALLVAVVPRRRDAAQVAALAAAVVIALQLATTHWFYLYVVWFAPLVFAALFARHPAMPAEAVPVTPEEARVERSWPAERAVVPASP